MHTVQLLPSLSPTDMWHYNPKDDDDEENETDAFAMEQMKSWVPEPVNADLKHTAKAQRMHDIISMLVHIYGSKDLFINEYR